MKRKYDCPINIKLGEYIYWTDGANETQFPYKVVRNCVSYIIVELNEDKIDDFMFELGWSNANIGNGKYWSVVFWTRVKEKNRVCISLE